MYYGSGTVNKIASGQTADVTAYAAAAAGRTLCEHSLDGRNFPREMTSLLTIILKV